eukprot:827896_1
MERRRLSRTITPDPGSENRSLRRQTYPPTRRSTASSNSDDEHEPGEEKTTSVRDNHPSGDLQVVLTRLSTSSSLGQGENSRREQRMRRRSTFPGLNAEGHVAVNIDKSDLTDLEAQFMQGLADNGSKAKGRLLRCTAKRFASMLDDYDGSNLSVMDTSPESPSAINVNCRYCLEPVKASKDVSSCQCKSSRLCFECMHNELILTFNRPPHDLLCTVCKTVYDPEEVEKP